MIAEGCTDISTNIIRGVWAEFRCAEEIEGEWSKGWFLFTPTGLEPLSGYSPICVDPSGMLLIRDQ